MAKNKITFLKNAAYPSLITFQIVTLSIVALNLSAFTGDFWDYAALIENMNAAFMYDANPFITEEEAPIPYWPFVALLSSIKKLVGLSSVDTLALFGPLNSLLLCLSIIFFCRKYSNNSLFPTLALCFVFTLWGSRLQLQSGFLHLEVFPFITSYPATLTYSICLIALTLLPRSDEEATPVRLLAISVFGTLAILTHPITSGLYLVGLVSFTSVYPYSFSLRIKLLILGILIPLLLASLWPIFPLLSSLASTGHLTATGTRMYRNVGWRIYPVAFGLIVTLFGKKSSFDRALLLSSFLLLLTFIAGYVFQLGSLGRVLSLFCFSSQLYIAHRIVNFRVPQRSLFLAVTLIVTLTTMLIVKRALSSDLKTSADRDCIAIGEFLSDIPRGSVVLSDGYTSKCFPPYGLKVLHTWLQDPNYPSYAYERSSASKKFFSPDTSLDARASILRKYSIDYIFLQSARNPSEQVTTAVKLLGESINRSDRYDLYKVKAP